MARSCSIRISVAGNSRCSGDTERTGETPPRQPAECRRYSFGAAVNLIAGANLVELASSNVTTSPIGASYGCDSAGDQQPSA